MKFVITGGASVKNNLGDQAMIYTLIEYLKIKYPESDIVLFDEDVYFDESLQDTYNFKVLPDIPMNAKLKKINKLLFLIYKILGNKNRFTKDLENTIINEYESCDCIFQLAGFTLSSQMKFINSISRIWDIAFAGKLNKKIIMLPQSIGPLDYSGIKKLILSHYIKKHINYPDYVLCREAMGKKLLENYGCKKAEIEHDLVLSRPDYIDPDIIYKNYTSKTSDYSVDKNKDIVIIPNFRFLKYRTESEIVKIFNNIVNGCIQITHGSVFIFNHVEDDDGQICRAIYSGFENNSSVIFVKEKFNCIETEKFFSKFAMAIPGRWHSNVHVIRAGLPHVVMGWAEKYHETARLFNNKDNVFDIRQPMVEKDFIEAIERVYNNRVAIGEQITGHLDEIKKTFCLDRITKHFTMED